MLGGYLVEAGRASCCAWEFHVYRPTSRHYPISYDDMAYMATVGMLADDDVGGTAESGDPHPVNSATGAAHWSGLPTGR